MKKIEMFDFNKLCEYYRKGEVDSGRIYLYENINVLTTKCGYTIRDDELSDMLWDIVLWFDERLNISLNKWYQNKEVFTYLKSKLRRTLINNNTRWDKMDYYIESNSDIDLSEEVYEKDENATLEIETIRMIVMDFDEPYRSIITLKHLCWWEYWFETIAKTVWMSVHNTKIAYNLWIEKIREVLDININ